MIEIYAIFIFILGTIIGSFLGVVAWRLNTGRGLGGRSMCFTCRRTLAWYELVPIVSYLVQGGRCHGCRSKIGIQEFIIEIVTGIVFVSLFFKSLFFELNLFQGIFYLVFFMYLFSLLIVVGVYDYKHKILPDKLVWLFNLLAFLSMCIFQNGVFGIFLPSIWALFAGPLVALPFFLLWFVTQGKGMGFGDVKLALGVGWLLGLTSGLAALVISFWIGGAVALFLLIQKRSTVTLKHKIAFGPFLIVAIFFVFVFNLTIQHIMLKLHF